MKIKRRNFGDNPPMENDVQSNEELFAIDWIKETWLNAGYTLAYSSRDKDYYNYDILMVVKNNSCFVIGFIDGNGGELGLLDYSTLVAK